ncbi:MAG TPA: hypothetical protein VFN57_15035 [Thermomicrobiaceae bacterium]|nr:hypothetical protein [Thermomicrobiaceae bacterium]
MVDEELAAQLRDVSGTVLAMCDLCGRPMAHSAGTLVTSAPSAAEPGEELLLCPECLLAYEQGEPLGVDDGDEERARPTQ